MKCLNRVEMQEYIDNEVNSSVKHEILMHLEKCEICSTLYNESVEDKALINKLLKKSFPESETGQIPDFRLPAVKRKKTILFRFALILAAASLTGVIFLVNFKRKPVTEKLPEAEMIMYEYLDGKDLNKLWHDKSQILIIEDDMGNVIQSIITY
jgi:hypothetical protein